MADFRDLVLELAARHRSWGQHVYRVLKLAGEDGMLNQLQQVHGVHAGAVVLPAPAA